MMGPQSSPCCIWVPLCLRKQPDSGWALWCEVFRLLLDPLWPSEEGRMPHVLWEGQQMSASWYVPLQTRNSSLAPPLSVQQQTCPCLPTFAAQSGCLDVCAAGTSLYQEGGERLLSVLLSVFLLCLPHLCEVPPRAQSHSVFSSINWRAPPTCWAAPPETPHPFYPPLAVFCPAGIDFLTPDLLFHPSRNQPPSKVSEMQCQARTLRAKWISVFVAKQLGSAEFHYKSKSHSVLQVFSAVRWSR